MNVPDKEQIEHWLKVSREQLAKKQQMLDEGHYEKSGLPKQGMYTTVALSHATIGRALFLNGDPVDVARGAFAKAARCILKSFTMAYDPTDDEYQDWRVDWSEVVETYFIDGMNYALISADFDLAKELAGWWQDRGGGKKPMHLPINRFTWALKYVVLGDTGKAWNDYLRISMEDFGKKPPKGYNWRSNYFTLSTALAGIALGDEGTFNDGLKMQLDFYRADANGEFKDTSYEFICDHAVALANLGLHCGLNVTVQHELLPRGLLIS
jgi:hypothetical protein